MSPNNTTQLPESVKYTLFYVDAHLKGGAEFRRVLEVASLLRWVDVDLLAKVLDESLQVGAADWYAQLQSLPFVEKEPSTDVLSVNEPVRSALWQELILDQRSEIIRDIAKKGKAFFSNATRHSRLQDIVAKGYLLVVAGAFPDSLMEIRNLTLELRSESGGAIAMATALDEYVRWDFLPAENRAWAALYSAELREYEQDHTKVCEYLSFAEKLLSDSGNVLGQALVNVQSADYRRKMVEYSKAKEYIEKGINILEEIEKNPSEKFSDLAVKRELVRAWSVKGEIYFNQYGISDQTLECLQKDYDLSKSIYDSNSLERVFKRDLFTAAVTLGYFLYHRKSEGDLEKSMAALSHAVQLAGEAKKEFPLSLLACSDLAASKGYYGDSLLNSNVPEDREKGVVSVTEGLELFKKLHEIEPHSDKISKELGRSYLRVGRALMNGEQPVEALPYLNSAAELAQARFDATKKSLSLEKKSESLRDELKRVRSEFVASIDALLEYHKKSGAPNSQSEVERLVKDREGILLPETLNSEAIYEFFELMSAADLDALAKDAIESLDEAKTRAEAEQSIIKMAPFFLDCTFPRLTPDRQAQLRQSLDYAEKQHGSLAGVLGLEDQLASEGGDEKEGAKPPKVETSRVCGWIANLFAAVKNWILNLFKSKRTP